MVVWNWVFLGAGDTSGVGCHSVLKILCHGDESLHVQESIGIELSEFLNLFLDRILRLGKELRVL